MKNGIFLIAVLCINIGAFAQDGSFENNVKKAKGYATSALELAENASDDVEMAAASTTVQDANSRLGAAINHCKTILDKCDVGGDFAELARSEAEANNCMEVASYAQAAEGYFEEAAQDVEDALERMQVAFNESGLAKVKALSKEALTSMNGAKDNLDDAASKLERAILDCD